MSLANLFSIYNQSFSSFSYFSIAGFIASSPFCIFIHSLFKFKRKIKHERIKVSIRSLDVTYTTFLCINPLPFVCTLYYILIQHPMVVFPFSNYKNFFFFFSFSFLILGSDNFLIFSVYFSYQYNNNAKTLPFPSSL